MEPTNPVEHLDRILEILDRALAAPPELSLDAEQPVEAGDLEHPLTRLVG